MYIISRNNSITNLASLDQILNHFTIQMSVAKSTNQLHDEKYTNTKPVIYPPSPATSARRPV